MRSWHYFHNSTPSSDVKLYYTVMVLAPAPLFRVFNVYGSYQCITQCLETRCRSGLSESTKWTLCLCLNVPNNHRALSLNYR